MAGAGQAICAQLRAQAIRGAIEQGVYKLSLNASSSTVLLDMSLQPFFAAEVKRVVQGNKIVLDLSNHLVNDVVLQECLSVLGPALSVLNLDGTLITAKVRPALGVARVAVCLSFSLSF